MTATKEQFDAFKRAKHDILPEKCTLLCANITPASMEDVYLIRDLVCEGIVGRSPTVIATESTLVINYLNATLGIPSLAVSGWEKYEPKG